jgi:hypothetical protein
MRVPFALKVPAQNPISGTIFRSKLLILQPEDFSYTFVTGLRAAPFRAGVAVRNPIREPARVNPAVLSPPSLSGSYAARAM